MVDNFNCIKMIEHDVVKFKKQNIYTFEKFPGRPKKEDVWQR